MTECEPVDGADPELARAELYGLLARLWFAPPDAALAVQIAGAPIPAGATASLLGAPWQALAQALRSEALDSVAREYETLFQGVGKPEVFLYGSYYLAGFLNEKPLAALRADLTRLGLAGDAQRGETEDHVAFVFEVMRFLIAGDEPAICTLGQQQSFFRAHVQTWVEALCDAVAAQPRARVYGALADLTRAFVQVETQAFDLEE